MCAYEYVNHLQNGSPAIIETRLRTGRSGFNSRKGQWWDFFLFATALRLALGPTEPPIKWISGALNPDIKRLGRETDHSHPSRAEAKKAWSYAFTPHYFFMEW